jgi:hypothetical protein
MDWEDKTADGANSDSEIEASLVAVVKTSTEDVDALSLIMTGVKTA